VDIRDDADGDVSGNDREGDVQLAVVQMDVGAAHLGVERPQQRCSGLQSRRFKLSNLQRLERTWHDDSGDGHRNERGA